MKFIKRLLENRKYQKERERKGYCEKDLWNIEEWFFNIIPNMLKSLLEDKIGYPLFLQDEFYELNKNRIGDIKKLRNCNELGIELREEMDEYCINRYKEIVNRIIYLFNESSKDKCSYKNKYEDEFFIAFNKFFDEYGLWGEKKDSSIIIKQNNGDKISKKINMCDIDEYKEIDNLYHEEEEKIEKYQNKCKKEAVELFFKYLDTFIG